MVSCLEFQSLFYSWEPWYFGLSGSSKEDVMDFDDLCEMLAVSVACGSTLLGVIRFIGNQGDALLWVFGGVLLMAFVLAGDHIKRAFEWFRYKLQRRTP